MASRTSAATERALRRHRAGARITDAARAEGIAASTLFRALKRPQQSAGRFVIVGAGSLGRELAQWIGLDERPESVAFLDDTRTGPLILGNVDSYERAEGDEVLVAIADPQARARVADQFLALGTYIAAGVMTGNCRIGQGSMLFPHSLVSADVTLGMGCIVNTYTSIGHDVEIGDFTTLCSHVDICGRVRIGRRVFMGSGARVVPDITIGSDAYIGAGAVVVKDVPDGARLFGNPARAIA